MTMQWIKSMNIMWKEYNTEIKPIKGRGQPILNEFIAKYNLCISKSLNIQDKKDRIYTTLQGGQIKGNIKNKGTGAGGANTNKNGLSYEEMTEIKESDRYKYTDSIKVKTKMIKQVIIDGELHIKINKAELKLYMNENKKYNTKSEKALEPDECYINESKKIIYILEKKFQQTSGSVDEKIQTGFFKIWFYNEQYPDYEIKYCYCLSDWFKSIKYKPEMRFFKKYEIDVFWGSDDNYADNILNWIINKPIEIVETNIDQTNVVETNVVETNVVETNIKLTDVEQIEE